MTERDERLSTDDLLDTRGDRTYPEGAPGDRTYPEGAPTVAPTETTAARTETRATRAEAALLPESEAEGYRRRWDAIQARFVDTPRDAVADADELVADLMRHLAEVFASERGDLEASWGRGENLSTEDLRMSLQRYRSFFNRLLST